MRTKTLASSNDAAKRIRSQFNAAIKAVKSERVSQKIADEMAETMQIRVQLGGSVKKTGASKSKFKNLKPKTVEKRKNFKGLSSRTSPKKSNVTMTGQLVDSIKGVATNGQVVITVGKNRKGESLTNDELIEYLEEGGRPFFYLSDKEIKKVTRLFQEAILDQIRKRFK